MIYSQPSLSADAKHTVPEYPPVLVSEEFPGTNPPQMLRNDCTKHKCSTRQKRWRQPEDGDQQ